MDEVDPSRQVACSSLCARQGVPQSPGQSRHASHSDVKFDNFKAYRGVARDAMTPRVGGLGDTSLSSGELLVKSNILDHRGGETIVEGFHDDYFVAQADVQKSGYPEIWVRYTDANNAYRIFTKSVVSVHVKQIKNGEETSLGSASISGYPGMPYELRVRVYDDNGTDKIDVYTGGTKQLTVTLNDPLPAGGVAFACKQGYDMTFDNAKVGYDNNGDGDIADAGDDLVWSEAFGSTSKTVSHDHAGNLIDDGTFRYVYDAWNRLVKVQSSQDSGAASFQDAEFFADGRRARKVVTSSGDHDGTVVYLYDGQKIIETRDGSGNLYQQFVHGTQYIDELVMIRVKDKGDLYVHQDANWNVIGLTDLGGSLVERYVYTPYGELTVYEHTGYGDRDADCDVDATDKGTPGTTCTGTVSGACRILDFDFDGDYDSTDASKFDSLPQGLSRHPGRIATNVSQPFAHQGLLYEPEVGQYQNRARQYDPAKRRFVQRDPAGQLDGLNGYQYVRGGPVTLTDASGLWNDNVHFDWTYEWCRDQTAILHTPCCWISYYDMQTDQGALGPMPGQTQSLHFDRRIDGGFGDEDSRFWWARNLWDFAKGTCRRGDFTSTFRLLGTALHALQDWFAHGQVRADDPGPIIVPHGGIYYGYYDNPTYSAIEGVGLQPSYRPPTRDLGREDWHESTSRIDATRDTTLLVLRQFRCYVCRHPGPCGMENPCWQAFGCNHCPYCGPGNYGEIPLPHDN